MIDEPKLERATIAVLMDHMGVAAQFAAEDALATFRSKRAGNWSDDLMMRSYFIALAGQLPAGLPVEAIKKQILTLYQKPDV
jgi:hypothetical protein